MNLDADKLSVLVPDDLSVAFDTANQILVNRLRDHTGLSGSADLTALPLIFLAEFSVTIKGHFSKHTDSFMWLCLLMTHSLLML